MKQKFTYFLGEYHENCSFEDSELNVRIALILNFGKEIICECINSIGSTYGVVANRSGD
jgi:hypothetical protein